MTSHCKKLGPRKQGNQPAICVRMCSESPQGGCSLAVLSASIHTGAQDTQQKGIQKFQKKFNVELFSSLSMLYVLFIVILQIIMPSKNIPEEADMTAKHVEKIWINHVIDHKIQLLASLCNYPLKSSFHAYVKAQ